MRKKTARVIAMCMLLIGILTSIVFAQKAEAAVGAPVIKSVSMKTKVSFKIDLQKAVPGAAGYDVWYSTDRTFKTGVKKAKVSVKSGATSFVVPNIVTKANKAVTYYVKVSVSGKNTWSNVVKRKVAKAATLDNTSCLAGLECDVKVTGSGTGYHAKLVITTGSSALSFGIQCDKASREDFARGNQAIMIENVASNAPGDQIYDWPKQITIKPGSTHHLMVLITRKGKVGCYFDYQLVGTYSNVPLAQSDELWTLVEGSCRMDGDKINVKFSNIRKARPTPIHGSNSINRNAKTKVWNQFRSIIAYPHGGIKSKITANYVQVKGTLSGLNGKNWDDPGAFGDCSTSVRVDNEYAG